IGGNALAIRGCAACGPACRSGSGCRARSPFTAGFMAGPRSDSRAFLATSTQLPRGYSDGHPDALKYRVGVSQAVYLDHPNPAPAVVVQHRLRELVVFVHTLGNRLPRVVGAPLDRSPVQDPFDQYILRHVEGDHEIDLVALGGQHLVERARLLQRPRKPIEKHALADLRFREALADDAD